MKKLYQKVFSLKASAYTGAEISPEMMTSINRFALKELTVDEVYVRKFLMAHNGIDRDIERFPEGMLDEFSNTFPGKSFMVAHQRRTLAKGLYFDAATEEMIPERFLELTGEEINLPQGIQTAKVLWGWIFMLKAGFNEELMANIDAGIYRHVSIGFRAADMNAVKDQANGPVLYWEYVSPGEATEGSLVWLGAQPGATAQKAQKIESDKDMEGHEDNKGANKDEKIDKTEGGTEDMKDFLKRLSGAIGKTLTEENAIDETTALFTGKDAEISTLKDKISELEPFASDGRIYRKELVESYVTLRTKLEEIKADDESRQKQAREVAGGFPVEFLKSEVEALQARVNEKFPDEGQLKGEDPEDSRKKEDKKNPLVPSKEK